MKGENIPRAFKNEKDPMSFFSSHGFVPDALHLD